MHSQLFSNKTRGFYPVKNLRYYQSVGALPDDLIRIPDAEYAGFIGAAPANCVPNYNADKKEMEWLSVTPPEKRLEDIIAENQAELMRRQRAAAISAFPLQSAVDLGVASDEVKSQLNDLKKYVVALMEVDVTAPDWPATPEFISI